MDTNNSPSGDIPYTLLPELHHHATSDRRKGLAGVFITLLVLSSLVALIFNAREESMVKLVSDDVAASVVAPPSRGPEQGVSEKGVHGVSGGGLGYNWTNAMLTWQRTAYHFQPHKNWMNDPNGPLFHMDWYHLFYQYNPDSAVWGNITWGHAVSRDLIHWLYLPLAMVPDHWFDWNGVWTGSATLLPDGRIIILYTGDTDNYVQVQNLAYPANLSDPLLLDLVKYENNPVMVPPPGIALKDFRDPTTAWRGKDGKWRVAVGSKVNTSGIALVFQTENFTSYDLLDGVMHAVPGTGMWECVDFYPISTVGANGLDTSVDGPGVKHVLKASLDDEKKDFYALGTYYAENDTWTPDNPDMDVGIGLRVDYGKYYASKTFYDQNTKRRILWGWIGETDNEGLDLLKGWASVQTVPRTIVFDEKTKTNIIQWPIDEVEALRLNSTEFTNVLLEPGSIVPLNITPATQLDITVTFEVDGEALEATLEADVIYNCSTSSAANRGALGPFGFLVIADDSLSEFTPIYFYIAKDTYGGFTTFFCADELKSTMAHDVNKQVYGSSVPVLDGEKLSMRLLVDHSIVESFAQGGRTVITSRIYPTKATYGAARAFLFNNATGISVTASLEIWEMESADIHPYPLEEI